MCKYMKCVFVTLGRQRYYGSVKLVHGLHHCFSILAFYRNPYRSNCHMYHNRCMYTFQYRIMHTLMTFRQWIMSPFRLIWRDLKWPWIVLSVETRVVGLKKNQPRKQVSMNRNRFHMKHNFTSQFQGSHFFPLTKFPDFSSIFSIFPWLY